MVKYVLHGGATSKPSIHNENFFKEMVKSLAESVKILTVYFAIKKEKWNELLEDDKRKFSLFNPNIEMEFTIASNDIEIFSNQIQDNNLIYIRGGEEMVFIQEQFNKIKNLQKLFQDKVVGGSSAGAYILSKYYYSNDLDEVRKGTGLLPIKVFCHYSDEKVDKLKILKEYGEDLEVYTIPETEFVVIKK